MMEKTPDRRSWHLEKNISIGHLLTTIMIAGSVLVWAMRMDTRVAVVESFAVEQKTINKQHEEADSRLEQVMREDLREMRADIKLILSRVQK